MTRICENPRCGKEFEPHTVRQKYCHPSCTKQVGNARQVQANRRNALRHAATAFAVVGGMLDQSNPNISAAAAEWELRSVYSQPHPCGASERN